MQFVSRDNDEFGAFGPMATLAPAVFTQQAQTHGQAGLSNGFSSTAMPAVHALLPPQHHRVGMTAAELQEARTKEAQAREALQQRNAAAAPPAPATAAAAVVAAQMPSSNAAAPVPHAAPSDAVADASSQPKVQEQAQTARNTSSNGSAPMEMSE
jgi:hypothetical protein